MRKLITACMALAAFLAFAVAPAFANNDPQLTDAGGLTKAGTEIVGTNVGETLMTDVNGNVLTRCTTATMKGTVSKNEGSTVAGEITSAVFGGSGGTASGYSEPECTGTFGNVSVTATALPWCLHSSPTTMTTDEFQVRGGKCNEAAKPIKFDLDSTTIGNCEYERTTGIPGTYTTGGTAAEMSISKVEFKKSAGGFLCPGAGYLDMTFKLETSSGAALTIS